MLAPASQGRRGRYDNGKPRVDSDPCVDLEPAELPHRYRFTRAAWWCLREAGVEQVDEVLAGVDSFRERLPVDVDGERVASGVDGSLPHGVEHACPDGKFCIFVLPEPFSRVVCVDGPAGQLYLEPPKTDRFVEAHRRLTATALSPEESLQWITQAARRMEGA